jgi:benzil reductase ((S)-benzoin forming)
MMDCYYVTGASRGIGKAIVECILEDSDSKVVGIARSSAVDHPRYSHRTLDLTEIEKVQAFRFDQHTGAERAILVNNAAILKVAQVGNIDTAELISVFQADALAPALLLNAFVSACRNTDLREVVICNLTSRAGSTAIPGGAAYCASKAALEMFTHVAAREAQLASTENTRFLIANPGETDTDMQTYLAESDSERFPYVEMVRQRKADGELMSPTLVAKRLVRVLKAPGLAPGLRFDVQELPLV